MKSIFQIQVSLLYTKHQDPLEKKNKIYIVNILINKCGEIETYDIINYN